jgi:hypothetical protein
VTVIIKYRFYKSGPPCHTDVCEFIWVMGEQRTDTVENGTEVIIEW